VNGLAPPEWPDLPALFLDLDGTLLEFAENPGSVTVPEGLRETLGRLAGALRGAIAFISGRTLADLDRLLGPGEFPLAAVHGLQRRDAAGRLTSEVTDARALELVHHRLAGIAASHPGTILENKGVTLALHYRRCPEVEQTLLDEVEAILGDCSSELRLMRGSMVLEIRPEQGDKGRAIGQFMGEAPFQGRTPVFVGDDVTDEDGFRTVNALGGISIKVGDGPTCARHRLANTRAVIDWLNEFVAEDCR